MTALAAPLIRFIEMTMPRPKPVGGSRAAVGRRAQPMASVVLVTVALMLPAFVAITDTAPPAVTFVSTREAVAPAGESGRPVPWRSAGRRAGHRRC